MGSTFADSDYGDTVESQFTLGTASLLGIFFGLVMVCGIFFGFGYSIGRRNSSAISAAMITPAHVTPAPVAAAPVAAMTTAQQANQSVASLTPETIPAGTELSIIPAAAPITLPATTLLAATPKLASPAPAPASTSQAKVSAGVSHPTTTTAMQRASGVPSSGVLPLTAGDHAYIEPKARIAKPSAIQATLEQTKADIPLRHPVPAPQLATKNLSSPYFVWTPPFDVHYKRGFKHSVTETASRGPLTGVSHPAGEFLPARATAHLSPISPPMTVQVAALSRQDDAEVLVSALRQRGYAPSIQSGSEDALYHVEVGPFSRDVAFATRQRLIAKGYNATLK